MTLENKGEKTLDKNQDIQPEEKQTPKYSDDEKRRTGFDVVRQNAMANPNLYDGRYTQEDEDEAFEAYKADVGITEEKEFLVDEEDIRKGCKFTMKNLSTDQDDEFIIEQLLPDGNLVVESKGNKGKLERSVIRNSATFIN